MTMDPYGKDQHEPGAKLDQGKNRLGLMIGDFAGALDAVARVTTYGAQKYTPGGWKTVPEAKDRYSDAMYRHLLAHSGGEKVDAESGLPHLAHAAWNALAVLQLQQSAEQQLKAIDDLLLEVWGSPITQEMTVWGIPVQETTRDDALMRKAFE